MFHVPGFVNARSHQQSDVTDGKLELHYTYKGKHAEGTPEGTVLEGTGMVEIIFSQDQVPSFSSPLSTGLCSLKS